MTRNDAPALDVTALLSQSRFLHALARDLARDVHTAEDLVQDAFVAALASPPRHERGLRAWLATVVRRRAARKALEARTRRERELTAARAECQDDAELRDQRVHLQRRLADAILTLDEPYRSAVVMRWLEDRSIEEVARIQGCTQVAMRQRLSRALGMLRTRLDREYDGRAWSLVALSLPDFGSTASNTVLGGIVPMSLSTKLVGAAAVIALAVLFVWRFRGTGETDAIAFTPASPTNLMPSTSAPTPIASVEAPNERLAVAPPPTTAHDENTLHGIVLDDAEAPVAGADIEMIWREGSGYNNLYPLARADSLAPPKPIASTRSDAAGRFAIPLAPGRPFDLRASSKGLAPTLLLNRFAGEEVTVRLTRGSTIHGTVTRKSDGSPVIGAEIRGFPSFRNGEMSSAPKNSFLATTDAFGRYSIPDLAPGNFRIACTPLEDAPPPWGRADLGANATIMCNFEIEPGFDIEGLVFDRASKKPIADAEVGIGWVMRRPVRTGVDGRFVLRNFPTQGNREIGTRARGYGCKATRVIDENRVQTRSVEIGLLPSQTLVGRVLDFEQKPVAGAFVAAIGSSYSDLVQQSDFRVAHTENDGSFSIDDVRADLAHVLAVRADGFGHVVIDLPAEAYGKTQFEFGDVILARGLLVRGVLVDPRGVPIQNRAVELVGPNVHKESEEFSAPGPVSGAVMAKAMDPRVVNAFVDLYSASRTVRTDDRGRFTFGDVAEGDFEVKCESSDRRHPATVNISVTAAKPLPLIELVAEIGNTVSGRVIDAAGVPLEGAHVRVLLEDASGAGYAQTDAQGRFTAFGVPPGSCRVRVESWSPRDGPLLAPTTSEVFQSGQADCVVRMPLGRSINGVVVERDGKVPQRLGVELRVAGAEKLPFYLRTEADGSFAFVVPIDAACTVRAVDSGRESAEVSILDATGTVRLELPPR